MKIFFSILGPKPMSYGPLIIELGDKFAKKHHLVFSSFGGKFMGGLNTISISLISHEGKQLDVPEARRLIIPLVDDLVNTINADSHFAPFLIDSPFTEKRIDIHFMNYKKNNERIYEPAIGTILFFEGRILYRVNSKINPYSEDNIVKKETYDEAVEILRKEKEEGR